MNEEELRRELYDATAWINPDERGLSRVLARIAVRHTPPDCRCGHTWLRHMNQLHPYHCPICMCPRYQRWVPILRPLRVWPVRPQPRQGPQNLGGWSDLPYE